MHVLPNDVWLGSLCSAKSRCNTPDCQAPSSERYLTPHRVHQPAPGGLTPPPATKDTSCHTGDFLSLTVISCSENRAWDCAVYLKIMTVVNVLILRWLFRLQGNRLRHSSCEGGSQLPTRSCQHTPFSLCSFPISPSLPTAPHLNCSNGQ